MCGNGEEQQGLAQGYEAGCGGGWLAGSAGSLQSRDYSSRGRGAGRGGLGDTVERRLPVHGHCEGERKEQGRRIRCTESQEESEL